MTAPFRSPEEYEATAHRLYSLGRYDEALTLLRDAAALYPGSVDLRVGIGYAYLALEQIAWAREAFELALILEPEHTDALAGMGEVALVIGQMRLGLGCFQRLLDLGEADDLDLMLQVGRALFREGFFVEALRYFESARVHHVDAAELAAALGYTTHRLGLDADAFYWLRRAIALDGNLAEPRIYLANILYERNENAAALFQFMRLAPDDHEDELGLWRTIELLKCARGLDDESAELLPWLARIASVGGEYSPEDIILIETSIRLDDGGSADPTQIELFGTLMSDVPGMQRRGAKAGGHLIETLDGLTLRGNWDDLLLQLQVVEGAWPDGTVGEFMELFAERGQAETGVRIPTTDAEAFLRGAALAGVIRILE